ncbi:MAG: hypothetical protein ABI619_02820 [Betaproteobacteria bacterium]
MALTIYAFHAHPHDFAVTKVGAPIEECVFVLDFSRSLQRVRWFGTLNYWLGPTVALTVPVVHRAEQFGGYVISVHRSEPYFVDLPRLWKQHSGSKLAPVATPINGLELIADFAVHFPEGS